MNCPHCNTKVTNVYLGETGGCMGRHGDEEHCYCDSADFHMQFDCPNKHCGVNKYKMIRFRRERLLSNYVPGLGDKYAIERWIKERLG